MQDFEALFAQMDIQGQEEGQGVFWNLYFPDEHIFRQIASISDDTTKHSTLIIFFITELVAWCTAKTVQEILRLEAQSNNAFDVRDVLKKCFFQELEIMFAKMKTYQERSSTFCLFRLIEPICKPQCLIRRSDCILRTMMEDLLLKWKRTPSRATDFRSIYKTIKREASHQAKYLTMGCMMTKLPISSLFKCPRSCINNTRSSTDEMESKDDA